MNSQEIQDILEPIDKLWNAAGIGVTHLVDFIGSVVGSWHGYGWREEANKLVISPFVDNSGILPFIQARLSALPSLVKLQGLVKVEGLVIPRFMEIGNVRTKKLTEIDTETETNAFQPGNAVQRDCSSACHGTIGAFLTAERDNSTWLLSNRHVMADCPRSQLLGAGRVVLGTDVRCIAVNANDNAVDAGVVKIEDPFQVDPGFGDLRIRQSNPAAMASLRDGEKVSKLGNFSQITSGKLVLNCPKVRVKDCAGVEREFVQQLAISNGNNGPFAGGGDSGAVVVNNEHPIGLLFAMSGGDVEIPDNQTLKPPFYLANRWDNVIQALQGPRIVGSSLKLMLTKKAAAAH